MGVKEMMKKILTVLATVAMLGLSGQAFAEDTASNPSGLGNSYNFTVPETGPTTCCTDKDDGYDHKNANGNAVAIMQNTNQKLAAVQLAIIETLRLMTGQLSGNSREQTGAEHTLADQQDDRATVKAVEAHTLQAINDAASSPSACRIPSGSPGGGLLPATQKVAAAYNAEMMNWLDGTSTMSKQGQDAAVLNRLEMHCQKFASENDVADGVCEAQVAAALQGADLDASKSLNASNGVVQTLTADQLTAAQAYILNTMAPVPFTNLSPSEANTTEGRLRAQRQQTDMARISQATSTAAKVMANRAAITDDAKLVGWAKGNAANMQGYEGADWSKGMSMDDWLAIMSRSFLLNADELKNAEETPAQATKQIKNMMAVQTYQQYENYLLMREIALNLAQQTAILAEGARTDVDFTSKDRQRASN
jgi:hypothetical protein